MILYILTFASGEGSLEHCKGVVTLEMAMKFRVGTAIVAICLKKTKKTTVESLLALLSQIIRVKTFFLNTS